MSNISKKTRSMTSTSTSGVNVLSIDTPVAHNTLLNKSASQSTSLYQQCSQLRARLNRIRGFPPFFTLSTSTNARQSTDPVTQLWDLFTLGTPLCFIFNLLKGVSPIPIQVDPELVDISNEKPMKRAIALFAMQIRQVAHCEPFTVTDLWDRNSTDGLVKVINTVTAIVDQLPEDRFEGPLTSSPTIASYESTDSLASQATSATLPADAKEAARNNIVREIVETERKYVQDLEIMQKYSIALSQSNVINQDTIHLLFPGLNKLLNFQRKFLIRVESNAELPWIEQRWGLLFVENEEEFVVYEPYCANYTNATDLMLANVENLMGLNNLINARSELPAFLIKPVQRICKYPLLLDSLIKASTPANYPFYDELLRGSAAAKRITDKINEAQRRAENEQTVKLLYNRVEDWKGHHLSNFGELLLDDIFIVTKSEVDREYHVFLFEKIILCCKEALPAPPNSARKPPKPKKSLLNTIPIQGKKDTPLLLKGRIFLNNVTQAVPQSPRFSTASISNNHALAVWWRGDDDLEFFTLRCRTEEQMKQWEGQLNKLIREAAVRRASNHAGISKVVGQIQNSTNPAIQRSQSHYTSASSTGSSVYLNSRISKERSRQSPYGSEEQVSNSNTNGYPNGAHYSHDGFDVELDEEDLEDYPPTTNYPPSGRGTPMGARRTNAVSMPPERDAVPGYDRPRAQTEDGSGHTITQWRSMPPPLPSSVQNGFPTVPSRPTTPHLPPNGVYHDQNYGQLRQRPPLKSQFSSAKLSVVYDGEPPKSRSPIPPSNTPAMHRSRSASQPTAYVPKAVPPPPPMPTSTWNHRPNNSQTSNKRGSGSSQSTGDSSDYSPNSSSPITPIGSSESSLAGVGMRGARSQHFEGSNGPNLQFSPPVKVKVHFHEDIFVIQVPRATEFSALVEKVGRKIRLCGPRRDDGPLRVKYRDEDGDMISLGSTEDVQMAFEQFRPGGQVTLYVT